MKHLLTLALPLSLCAVAPAAVTQRGDNFVLSGAPYELRFNAQNGALESIATGAGKTPIWRGGEFGLWQLRFKDGTLLSAKDCAATVTPDAPNNALSLQFRGADADVTVRAVGTASGADLRGTVVVKRGTALDFHLPARLRFAPENVQRLIFPMSGQTGTGWALKSGFFQKQNGAAGWQPQVVGPQGYAQLFGAPLNQLGDNPPPVALQSTPQGREWLGEALAKRLDGHTMSVNRASKPEQTDFILVNSPNGPWLSASRLGGAGALWRIANSKSAADAELALASMFAVVEKLAASARPAQRKIGLIALQNGPAQGAWSAVKIADLVSKFQSWRGGRTIVLLKSPAEMHAALRANDFLSIVNPYGEHLPADETDKISEVVSEIGAYVKAGGNWWEIGGYPFYTALRPLRYYAYAVPYPPAFADFAQQETPLGTAAIYGVQPQNLTPWIGAQDTTKLFVPGRLATGGDENGGYFERNFGTFVPEGQSWTAPIVRIAVGGTPEENLRAYALANNFTRSLESKVKSDVLAKMRGAMLVKLDGNARDKTAALPKLPAGSIVHFSDYLKGGFDKEYPDHLPPHPNFGTPEEFKAFLQRCRELGHLSMPYTNPTWWCDHPRGPAFEKWGDAPLLRDLDGKLAYEKYGDNDGWTTTFWHPAVQEANRKTVRQFLEEYPVDIQFQDQLGARTWRYDTNSASPTPYAYYDGLISQGLEDSFKAPLGTEDGHDRVINAEAQLCGLAWGVVPFENAPEWRRLLRDQYAPATWELFPMAQILAHDKTAFYFHDLGAFVTNRETLAYALALGFNMSYRINANQLDQDGPREWLKWLDRLQKSVGAKTFGQPMAHFKHDYSAQAGGNSYVSASYGPVDVEVNLSPTSSIGSTNTAKLPPFGWVASVNGVGTSIWAGSGSNESSYFLTERSMGRPGVQEKTDIWLYAPAETVVSVAVPRAGANPIFLFDGNQRQTAHQETATVVSVKTPARPGQNRAMPPADLLNKAPKDWPQKPAIAVLDFAVPVNASWTKIAPTDWKNALAASRLTRRFGAEIKSLKNVDELFAALAAGPRAYAAIINPYPEIIFAKAPGTWKQSLDAIRTFVNSGGAWWETGGSSFYHELSPAGGAWQRQEVGGAGAAYLGLTVGGGPIEAPKEVLRVPERAKAWLGADLATQIEKMGSMVNRGLPRGSDDAGHFTIIGGENSDFLGGYRLNGWGYLWRTGGFYPNPEVAVPATVAALEYLYSNPAPAVEGGGTSYLWHAVLN